MNLGKYIKEAFINKWHLLAFLGGLGFSVLSPFPDVALSLLAAAEIAYLSLLGTHSKFQKHVDAQEAKAAREQKGRKVDHALQRVLAALPPESVQRFQALRTRCADLRQIALDLERPGSSSTEFGLTGFQLAGLDRLLWIYLKLLFTEFSLGRFFEATQVSAIQQEIERIEAHIKQVEGESTSSQRDRILDTLRDNLQTCRQRLTNYQKAKDNFELVQFEIERLENKIRSISELAVNRQEPNFISAQVDQVADSMLKTEETINQLQFVTGLETTEDAVPELVQREVVSVQQ